MSRLLQGKKFTAIGLAIVVALIGPIARYFGISVDQGALDHAFIAFLTYVGAQSMADFGHGAAQVTADPSGVLQQVSSIWSDLLTSKKFQASACAAFVAIVGPIAKRLGINVDQGTLDHIFLAFLVYVGGQGVTDFGKSAAEVRAKAARMQLDGTPK